MIARDLVNFYRDKNYANTRFIGTIEDLDDGTSASHLLFYTVGRTKARIDQPEGDIYEVEYYVVKDEEQSALMRRLWPNPHIELEPGGILTAIAENIEIFNIRYFDGEEWLEEWPEESQSLPHLAEIMLVGKQVGRAAPAMESVLVKFVRDQGTEGGTLTGAGMQQGGDSSGGSSGNSDTSSGGDR